MKKIVVCVLVVMIAALLVACGAKCYNCGKSLSSEKSYEAFGNRYCEHCFMYDLGI